MKTTKRNQTSKAQSPLRNGNAVFIRTVTMYYTGQIVGVTKDEVLLANAAWIADTGRFSTALSTGQLSEIEPYPDGIVVSVSRGAIIDACAWTHALPRATK